MEILQVHYYFTHFPNDNRFRKNVVLAGFGADILSTLGGYACVYLVRLSPANRVSTLQTYVSLVFHNTLGYSCFILCLPVKRLLIHIPGDEVYVQNEVLLVPPLFPLFES